MKTEEFIKKVKDNKWTIKRVGGKTFINSGNICVGVVTDSVADEIVNNHNNNLEQGAGQ